MARPYLERGQDILILAFSSGLSTTANNARIRPMRCRGNSRSGKSWWWIRFARRWANGLFCYHVARRRQAGATLEETCAYAEEIRPQLCHWFTVDDLHFLKRGGRVSSTAAVVGTMLQIKPVLHVDEAGHLIPVSKVRGRRASLNALVTEMMKTALDPEPSDRVYQPWRLPRKMRSMSGSRLRKSCRSGTSASTDRADHRRAFRPRHGGAVFPGRQTLTPGAGARYPAHTGRRCQKANRLPKDTLRRTA